MIGARHPSRAMLGEETEMSRKTSLDDFHKAEATPVVPLAPRVFSYRATNLPMG